MQDMCLICTFSTSHRILPQPLLMEYHKETRGPRFLLMTILLLLLSAKIWNRYLGKVLEVRFYNYSKLLNFHNTILIFLINMIQYKEALQPSHGTGLKQFPLIPALL